MYCIVIIMNWINVIRAEKEVGSAKSSVSFIRLSNLKPKPIIQTFDLGFEKRRVSKDEAQL